MKKVLALIMVLSCTVQLLVARDYPVLSSSDTLLVSAFDLALRTVENNIENGIVKAGGDYGGEWTRDASINAWNAGSLIFPEESRNSLWAVTIDDGRAVGHQYWDKIIWVQGAYNHCMVTGDDIEPVYRCSATTMKELEDSVFCVERGLFNGPSVFNDGIAAYEEPIPDPELAQSGSYKHPNTRHICCLSTNCIYYWAYRKLAVMACRCGEPFKALEYCVKARKLRRAIRNTLYDKEANALYYLIDHNGDVHHFQEGLGYSFAFLSGVVSRKEASKLVEGVRVSEYGIPSICPDFKRYDKDHPGRHNNLVWPFVNAFWADAALHAGSRDMFEFELRNLADLAINKGEGMFYEIYNPNTGLPDGGWQNGNVWASCRDQTWSATGYLRMFLTDMFGLGFGKKGMTVNPDITVADDLACTALSGIKYRRHDVNVRIEAAGDKKEGTYVNGRKVRRAFVPCDGSEPYEIVIYR